MLTRLLFGLGNGALRQFFKTQWPTVVYNVTGVRGAPWSDQPADGLQLLTLDRRLRLDTHERARVQNGDTSEWDFTLLTKILMRSSLQFVAHGSVEFTELDKLRQIRNTSIGHVSDAALSTAQFTADWQDACDALKHFGVTSVDIAALRAGKLLLLPFSLYFKFLRRVNSPLFRNPPLFSLLDKVSSVVICSSLSPLLHMSSLTID